MLWARRLSSDSDERGTISTRHSGLSHTRLGRPGGPPKSTPLWLHGWRCRRERDFRELTPAPALPSDQPGRTTQSTPFDNIPGLALDQGSTSETLDPVRGC